MDFEDTCRIDVNGLVNLAFRNNCQLTAEEIHDRFTQFPGYFGVKLVDGSVSYLQFESYEGARRAHQAFRYDVQIDFVPLFKAFSNQELISNQVDIASMINFMNTYYDYAPFVNDSSWQHYPSNNYYPNYNYHNHLNYYNSNELTSYEQEYVYGGYNPHGNAGFSGWSNDNAAVYPPQFENILNHLVQHNQPSSSRTSENSSYDIPNNLPNSANQSSAVSSDIKSSETTESTAEFKSNLDADLVIDQLFSTVPLINATGQVIDDLEEQSKNVAVAEGLLVIDPSSSYARGGKNPHKSKTKLQKERSTNRIYYLYDNDNH